MNIPSRLTSQFTIRRRAGFTLVEILVVLGVLVILAALLLPVFARVRESGRSVQCASNLKQLYLAWQMYADDSDGRVMPMAIEKGDEVQTWTGENFTEKPGVGALHPWLKSGQVIRCPSLSLDATIEAETAVGRGDVQGYGYNVSAFPSQLLNRARSLPLLSSIEKPAQLVVFADAALILSYPGDVPAITATSAVSAPSVGRPLFHGRHGGWGNVIWADGHIKAMQPIYMTARKWYPLPLQKQFQVGFLDRDGKRTTDEFFDLNPDAG